MRATLGLLAAVLTLAASRAAADAKVCPAGTRSVLASRPMSRDNPIRTAWSLVSATVRCAPCPKGAATARGADGRNHCIGGARDRMFTEPLPGVGFISVRRFLRAVEPLPCPPGRAPYVYDGIPSCLPVCPGKTVPVEDLGPVQGFECVAPLEPSAVDWALLSEPARQAPPPVPQCPAGQGVVSADQPPLSYVCAPCQGSGLSLARRFGLPVCVGDQPYACPQGWGVVYSAVSMSAFACAPCPKGTRLGVQPELGLPVCVDEAPRP